jgi:endonuclease YncB( thermonuclease family)
VLLGRATYVTASTLMIALLCGCGGSGDDAATDTTVAGPLTCTSADGSTFTTGMQSCGEAFGRGRQFATDFGLATGPDTPAAESAVATTCRQIQGAESVTYEVPEMPAFAEKLDSSGVCPGDVTLLVPPTTALRVVGVSTGWTLVDVIDGDTLDVTAPEGQRRIQLIGIDAPEPGACEGDAATNALRFLTRDKELTLVPDTSEVDAEGNNLFYVEQSDGVDLGGTMIDLGLAVAAPVEPDIARGGDYAQRMVHLLPEFSTPPATMLVPPVSLRSTPASRATARISTPTATGSLATCKPRR